MSLTVGSLFSGIGGLDLGLERAGMEVRWQCEIDKNARKVLAAHWPKTTCYVDVKETFGGFGSVPRVDVLCGGFPCQDVSVAGKRAGLAGERSGLFTEFIRIAGAQAPAWVVVENVPGLLSSNDGRDMGTVLSTLADIGYGWAYRVLDAQYLGVAQRRRRVFVVGHLGDAAGAAKVLFESESCDGDPAPSRQAGTGVAALTADGVGMCGADDNQGQAGHLIPDVSPTLMAHAGSGRRDNPDHEVMLPVADTLRSHPRPGSNSLGAVVAFHQKQDPSSMDDLSLCLGAKSDGMGVAFSENQRGELVESDYAHQLTTGGGKPGQGYPAVREGISVRRLTPRECERLQGFPDDWTACLADGARYRTLGNAVCVPVAEWIGRRIVEANQSSSLGAETK
jgi:DNA (cytosine-5)-methyltransferase 1